MLIVAKLFMNNFFFKVLIFLSEYSFRLVRFEISTRTENRTVLSRNIGTKRNGDFFLWIWDRILNFKIPNIWNGSGYLQIPDPPVPCTPLTPTTAEVLICCQDWLRSSSKPIQLEETIEDLESLESGMILL